MFHLLHNANNSPNISANISEEGRKSNSFRKSHHEKFYIEGLLLDDDKEKGFIQY